MPQRTIIHDADSTDEISLNIVPSTATAGVKAMPVVNPDGSNISITLNGNVNSAPTFKLDPTNSGEAAKYGKITSDYYPYGQVRGDVVTNSGTINTLSASVAISLLGNYGGVTIQITGMWSGTLSFQGYSDTGSWTTLRTVDVPTGSPINSTNQNGIYRFATQGMQAFRVIATAWTTGTATINLAGTFDSAPKFIPHALPNSTPYGSLKVSQEPTPEFQDTFDGGALDTTNKWNTPTGTLTPSVSGSVLAFPVSTTASAFGKLVSQPTFAPRIPSWIQHSWLLQLEATPVANTHRAWGFGSSPATPTTTTPLTDFIGFEIGTDGVMRASVYNSGTRIFSQALNAGSGGAGDNTQPVDGQFHRFICQVRTDVVYFYINTPNIPVATFQAGATAPVPSTQTLPLITQLVNAAAGVTTGATFNIQGAVVDETGHNAISIKDPLYPWRKQTVKGNGAAAVADDYTGQQNSHQTLVASTDTTINFSPSIRAYKVLNWDTSNPVLFSQNAIGSNTDSTAARVGVAPTANVPNSSGTIPLTTSAIHLRSAGASTVTVIGLS